MEFSRRLFMGGLAAASAGVVTPRGFASVRTGDEPVWLPRARAALDTHSSSIAHRDLVGIVDFSTPSAMPRFQLVDLGNGRVIANLLVAHGRGSDPANSGRVARLSNQPGSNASCQGCFMTGDGYVGKHGRSRRLIGLDADNNLALSRGIVVHAASYVDASLAATQGRIGRSLGCFAVAEAEIAGLLARLGPGRLLFAAK
jgi:hypothetical protein